MDSFFEPKGISRVADFFVSTGIPIIYGALHFLGWHAQFPTTAERLLWRIAAVGVASPGAVFVMLVLPLHALYMAMDPGKLEKAIGFFVDALLYRVIPSFYMLCSIYLYVESTRQLWYLAPEAYVVASWSYYFPHLF